MRISDGSSDVLLFRSAIVLWSPFVPFDQVASLASSRTYALRSAFRPTYNMAANLVRRYEPAQAHHLLNLSFAQYQSDQAVVRIEAKIGRASGRERVCQYVSISVVAGFVKKKNNI